jgi:site-specific recombinase XerD
MILFKLVLLKHKPDANDNYPIYLRITKFKNQKYINTKFKCKLNEWNERTEKTNRNKADYKKINVILNEILNQWQNKYNSLAIEIRESISLNEFIENVEKEKNKFKTLNFFDLIDTKIANLKEVGKIGTAKYYNDTKNNILKFTKGKDLTINSINVEWLRNYEKFLRVNDCIDSGIAVRMRAIRAIFNQCIENGIVNLDSYPFKVYKIARLKQDKKIRAINIEEIKAIANLDTSKHPKLKLSKDLFMFSYYSGGMNFKDIMLLKLSSVYNENTRLTYTRSKTKALFDFKLNDRAKEIVEYYKAQNIGTEYLFPILLKDNLTPLQISNRRQKCITQFNKDLKTIGMLCNIDFDLTSYVARHSFASNLKDKGIATDTISEAMGHQNIKVTQTYLKRLENSVIDNAMDSLIDF